MKNIAEGSNSLLSGTDYTVDTSGKITLKADYLNSLTVGDHVLAISYAPQGETYGTGSVGVSPTTTALTIHVSKATPTYDTTVLAKLTIEQGKKLSDVTLPAGFTWSTDMDTNKVYDTAGDILVTQIGH